MLAVDPDYPLASRPRTLAPLLEAHLPPWAAWRRVGGHRREAVQVPETSTLPLDDRHCRPRDLVTKGVVPGEGTWHYARITFHPGEIMNVRRSPARACAAVVAALSSCVGLALVWSAPAAQGALSQNADPGYQTNGRVSSIITVKNTVFIAGDFTSVRPAGAGAGTGEVARSHLAAFRRDTGALRGWNPRTNGPVSALAASPSGHTIFVGGDFSQLGGVTRHNLGAVSAKSGAATRFRAGTNGEVSALAVTRSRVYFGGSFTHVSGHRRGRLAAVNQRGRLLRRWRPRASGKVRSMVLSHDRRQIYVGGGFGAVNGHPHEHLAVLSARSGRVAKWKDHPGYAVWGIVVHKQRVYIGGNGVGGHVAAYGLQGKRAWTVQTDGGVQAMAFQRGRVIAGGHFRNICVGVSGGNPTGFTCPKEGANRPRLLALRPRSGAATSWKPRLNSKLGVFALATTGTAVYAGGDFTRVSDVDQQGFAHFVGH